MTNQKENNKQAKDALFPNCPIRNILARVGDKWSLLVLYTLQHKEPLRFKQLQRELPDISQKSLTQALRILEEDGFVHREVFAEVPPRVEYALSELGESMRPIIQSMEAWGTAYMERKNSG